MKNLTEYIKENLIDTFNESKNVDREYGQTVYNKLLQQEKLNREELKWTDEKVGVFKVDTDQLKYLIKNLNIYKISLNWLDVSKIKNMRGVFSNSQFTGDISKWDVSKVEDMSSMFEDSQFNGDISKWDVSSVKDMFRMFSNSQFNGDISDWDVSNVDDMKYMFDGCPIKDEYKPKF